MPLRLNVGLTQKVGQPNYGSLGASCHVEVELDSHLLKEDFEAFHQQVKNAFNACRRAVQDELKQCSGPDHRQLNSDTTTARSEGSRSAQRESSETNQRKATVSQIGALQAMTRRTNVDLGTLLYERFRLTDPTQLNLRQASSLIAELKKPVKVSLAA